MITHLGWRVSALLDGRLSPAEEERAWAHVALCPACQELVENEGWVKTRLAGLGWGATPAPAGLKGALVEPAWFEVPAELAPPARSPAGLGLMGGGMLGAMALGLVLLAAPAAQAPVQDARLPAIGPSIPGSPGSVADAGTVRSKQAGP